MNDTITPLLFGPQASYRVIRNFFSCKVYLKNYQTYHWIFVSDIFNYTFDVSDQAPIVMNQPNVYLPLVNENCWTSFTSLFWEAQFSFGFCTFRTSNLMWNIVLNFLWICELPGVPLITLSKLYPSRLLVLSFRNVEISSLPSYHHITLWPS